MKCRLRGFFQYWIPVVVYELIIFTLSSRPLLRIGPDIPNIDKLYHTIIYFIFALLLWRAFYYASAGLFRKRAPLFALILTIILGLSDEWHQYFVPTRDADIYDFLCDVIGACLAIIGIVWWNNRQNVGTSSDHSDT